MRLFTLAEIKSFWATKWKEAREESYALNLGNTTASATLVGYINAEDYALAVASILGFSECISSQGSRFLYRVAPVCHPRIMNLYASAVRITPYAFAEVSRPLNPVVRREVAPTFTYTYYNAPRMLEGFNVARYTSPYTKLRVEIDFSEFVGITFASDEQPGFQANYWGREYLRYTLVTFDYGLEVLQMDNAASLVFDAGPPKNQAFPTPVGVMLPQGKLYVKWMWVPHEFITDNPFRETKILYNQTIQDKIGKVNTDLFLGFDVGQLLFTSWKTEPIVIPVPDAETNSVVMKLAWNLEFEFLYLNPEIGATYQVPITDLYKIKGHNTFPWRGDGKFYPASIRKGDDPAPGKPLYKGANLGDIFLTMRIP